MPVMSGMCHYLAQVVYSLWVYIGFWLPHSRRPQKHAWPAEYHLPIEASLISAAEAATICYLWERSTLWFVGNIWVQTLWSVSWHWDQATEPHFTTRQPQFVIQHLNPITSCREKPVACNPVLKVSSHSWLCNVLPPGQPSADWKLLPWENVVAALKQACHTIKQ